MSNDFRAFEPPGVEKVAALLASGCGTLRDARDGTLYLWGAKQALHEEAIRGLGLGDHAENLGQIHCVKNIERLVGRRQ